MLMYLLTLMLSVSASGMELPPSFASFDFDMPADCYVHYFQDPVPAPTRTYFRLRYSPEAPEPARFSPRNVVFFPSREAVAIDKDTGNPVLGKAFYNGSCRATRIANKNGNAADDLETYSVSTVFCWAFPEKRLVFESIIFWRVEVAGGRIISSERLPGQRGENKHWTLKHDAVGNYTPTFLRMALEAGIDPNASLLGALRDPQALALLLEYGLDVNRKDEQSFTPLMWAAMRGADPEILKMLLRHGADANVPDKHNNNALIWAARNHKPAPIIRLLAERTDDLNLRVTTGFTAMGELLSYADADLLLEMLKRGAKPDITQGTIPSLVLNLERLKDIMAEPELRRIFDEHRNDMMGFALAVNLDSARFLHGLGWEWKGITMGPKDRPSSPVFLAAAYGSETNLVFLVDELAYPLNLVGEEGVALLKMAVHRDDAKVVAFFLSRGANPTARDMDGRSAADFAKSPEVRALLDRHGKENGK